MTAKGEPVSTGRNYTYPSGRLYVSVVCDTVGCDTFTVGRERYTAPFGAYTEHGWEMGPFLYTSPKGARRLARRIANGRKPVTVWHE